MKECYIEYSGPEDVVERFNKRIVSLVDEFVKEEKARQTPPNEREPWTDEDDWELLVELVMKTLSVRKLAKDFGRCPYFIRSRLDDIFDAFNWRNWVDDDADDATTEFEINVFKNSQR